MTLTKSKNEVENATHSEAELASEGLVRVIEQIASQVGARAHANTVFGTALSQDGVTLVPVARVVAGFGAGAGAGASADPEAHQSGRGGGLGGGGGFIVSPIGAFELGEKGVHFRRARLQTSLLGDLIDLLSTLTGRSR